MSDRRNEHCDFCESRQCVNGNHDEFGEIANFVARRAWNQRWAKIGQILRALPELAKMESALFRMNNKV